MIKSIFTLLIMCVLSTYSNSQITLTVEIYNLRNNKGRVHIQLDNQKEIMISGASNIITNKKCVFVFENLSPGKYAYKFIHDENNNEKLDTNIIGIPKEGFNFSNNPTLLFGPPSFDKTTFEIGASKTLKIKPRYFF